MLALISILLAFRCRIYNGDNGEVTNSWERTKMSKIIAVGAAVLLFVSVAIGL